MKIPVNILRTYAKTVGSRTPRSTGSQVTVADRHSPLLEPCRQHFRTPLAAAGETALWENTCHRLRDLAFFTGMPDKCVVGRFEPNH